MMRPCGLSYSGVQRNSFGVSLALVHRLSARVEPYRVRISPFSAFRTFSEWSCMSQFLKKRGGAVLITLGNGPLNTLSHSVRVELMNNLERAKVEKASAVVIMGEGQHFSAGPDLKEFARGLQASPSVREIVSYLDTYPTHLVAGMHGVAISSGFETALACHWRIGNNSTVLGLPDVRVGRIPGAGGTQRLPRLIDVERAAATVGWGDMISSVDAYRLGIIDELVTLKSPDDLLEAAINLALSDKVQGTLVADRRVSHMPVKGVMGPALVRNPEELIKKTGSTMILSAYEAITAAISAGSFEEGMEEELRMLTKLSKSKESKAIQYFFFNERRFPLPDVSDTFKAKHAQRYFLMNERQVSSIPSEYKVDIPSVSWAEKKVAIVGGGVEAVRLARMCSHGGVSALIIESSIELANSQSAILKEKSEAEHNQAHHSGEKILGVISCTSDQIHLKTADLVIDVSPSDDIEKKKEFFIKLDEICEIGTMIAINLGDNNIDDIVGSSSTAKNVFGTNFPPRHMIKQIFEVIPSKRSSNEALVTYVNFLTNFKKLSVFTGNSVGYMNNKILEPCLLESLSLIEEGVEPERIDKVLVNRLGLRAGPFHSIDLSGIEIKDLNDRKIKLENLFNEYQIELLKSKDEKPKLRKQPSTLPDDEIKDEEKVITIKVPVVLSNWYSDLLYKIYNANLKDSSILEKEGIPSGFYDYKGKGLAPNPAAKEVIEKHRVDMNIIQRDISDDEIFERCYYSLVNEAFNLLDDGSVLSPDDIDMIYVKGMGLSRHLGGLLYHAEHGIGLAKIYKSLKGYHENHFERPWLKPSKLLISVVESQASLKEEMYFLKMNRKQ